MLQARLECLQEAAERGNEPPPQPFRSEVFVPEPCEDITEGWRTLTAKGRFVPSSYAEEYEDHAPVELKDHGAPAADWVSRLYTGGMVVNGDSRVENMKPHPEGNRHIVFVRKDDIPELYDAAKQPQFREELRRGRQGARRRPRLVFPRFTRDEGFRTQEPLSP